ncbi:hypothetical protein [Catenovulum sediminis]|uniref:hypothetical protein n=1 Tax=Catenovulum sediminis TaxID=1740262 RepID=UPI001180ED42|nr:hypothetical protein [Catenovulum sediminis]
MNGALVRKKQKLQTLQRIRGVELFELKKALNKQNQAMAEAQRHYIEQSELMLQLEQTDSSYIYKSPQLHSSFSRELDKQYKAVESAKQKLNANQTQVDTTTKKLVLAYGKSELAEQKASEVTAELHDIYTQQEIN